MKLYSGIPFIFSAMILFGCVSHKASVEKKDVYPGKTQKQKHQTEEERQKMLQSEYKPEEHIKPINQDEENNLNALAMELAGYTCKKETFQNLIDAGESINPDQIQYIDEMITKIYNKAKAIANDPVRWQIFESKYNQHLEQCSE
jgi:hypothetical protein